MTQVSTDRRPSPVAELSAFMGKLKGQMALALPKHMNADRMTRLALTAFSTNPELQKCTYESIASSIMIAAQMGLEPGVNGQGYLIPYRDKCTFVPGWKGIVDISNRSGRASVWTGAVFIGDEFDYSMGDRPFITHKPGRSLGEADDLLYVYAVGRVRDSEWPIIEVWCMEKIWAHRDQYNKQGTKHYSYKNPEMYARKIPLLQVLKYMPTSIELATALDVTNAVDAGKGVVLEGNYVTIRDEEEGAPKEDVTKPVAREFYPDAAFVKSLEGWKKVILSGGKTHDAIIAMAESKHPLSDEQKATIQAITAAQETRPVVSYAVVADQMHKAKDLDALDTAGELIGEVVDPGHRAELSAIYSDRFMQLSN